MKKLLCITIASLLVFLATINPVFALENKGISNELDKMVQNLVEDDIAKGAVLSVVKDGKIQLSKGYGFADEFLGYAADEEKTAFRIGSVSKTFVAVAAQKLNEEGLLNMDSDISIYLEPNFPELSFPVTMQQLLTHTAGFEDMVTGIAVYNVSDTEELSESVRKYLPAQVYKPGEVISYSNYGIALAAYVIESIKKQDFAQYCQEQIFTPLNMDRTTFKYMHDIVYVSKPYLTNGNETIEPYMNLYPEGSVVSTADDMAKYMLWLLNNDDNRILSSESKKELFNKQFTMSEEFEGIGYIWNRKSKNNEIFYEKKGETLNFYTKIVLYPHEKTGVFISFNTYVPEHEINAIVDKATNLLYGAEQDYNIDSGESSININGLYVNNWSNFTTPEKILRYLIPGKILNISGSQDNGYYINGERMTLIGENAYSSDRGILKFINKDNKIIMATEAAITYVKVPSWQNSIIQFLVPAMFILINLAIFLREIILIMGKNRKIYNAIFLFSSLIQILSFSMLCFFMYEGIITFSLLNYALKMKICGWFIISTVISGIINIIYMKLRSCSINLIPLIWNISGVLFCIWMFWINII